MLPHGCRTEARNGQKLSGTGERNKARPLLQLLPMDETFPPRFEKLYRDNWGAIRHEIETQWEKFLPGESYVCFLLDTSDPVGRQVAEIWDDDLATTLQQFRSSNPDPSAKLVFTQIVEFEEAKRCLRETGWMPQSPPNPGHIAIAIVASGCAVIQVFVQNILDARPKK